MHYFDVHSNRFQGSIPSELDGLHSVEYLYLDHNQLAAQAPPAARLHCQSQLPTPTTIPTAHLQCLGALHGGLTLTLTLTLTLALTLTLTLTLTLILTLTLPLPLLLTLTRPRRSSTTPSYMWPTRR